MLQIIHESEGNRTIAIPIPSRSMLEKGEGYPVQREPTSTFYEKICPA